MDEGAWVGCYWALRRVPYVECAGREDGGDEGLDSSRGLGAVDAPVARTLWSTVGQCGLSVSYP